MVYLYVNTYGFISIGKVCMHSTCTLYINNFKIRKIHVYVEIIVPKCSDTSAYICHYGHLHDRKDWNSRYYNLVIDYFEERYTVYKKKLKIVTLLPYYK